MDGNDRTARPRSVGGSFRALLLFVLCTTSVQPCTADSSVSAVLYEITTRTAMPHLEENLRYTKTTEQHCLTDTELVSIFSSLSYESLQDCELKLETRDERSVSYRLVCSGSSGTIGEAAWRIDANQRTGVLNVKLGGKNMTFSQHVIAKPLRTCT